MTKNNQKNRHTVESWDTILIVPQLFFYIKINVLQITKLSFKIKEKELTGLVMRK